jgi:hypothetical protein
MPRRKNRTMKGGFWGSSITDMFKKKETPTPTSPSQHPSPSSDSSSPPSSTPSESTSSSSSLTGGSRFRRRIRRTRRMRRRRTMRGGYSANHSLKDLASTASPFSGNKTAQPQVWLGGRSRKHRHNRRCKH